jgi:hypothetical protein
VQAAAISIAAGFLYSLVPENQRHGAVEYGAFAVLYLAVGANVAYTWWGDFFRSSHQDDREVRAAFRAHEPGTQLLIMVMFLVTVTLTWLLLPLLGVTKRRDHLDGDGE